MAYSSLKRKTPLKAKMPLKAKSGFKPSCGFKKESPDNVTDTGDESPCAANERAKAPRKTTRSSLETHLDIVFSLFVRLRDAMPNGMVRCISCGRMFPFGNIQCGHLFTRHNRSVRWDEENCNPQCSECNCTKSGNLESYRPNLIRKIGLDAFEALCERAHKEKKWSGDELREMIRHYTAEVKRLSKDKGISVRI